MNEPTTYGPEVQELYLRFLLSDGELFSRCRNIIDPRFFNAKFQTTVEFLIQYSLDHNAIPKLDQIKAISGLDFELIEDVTEDQTNWVLDSFETFCRHKALQLAVVASSDLLEKEDLGEIEKLITEASQVGLVKDLGLEYFDDPKARLTKIRDSGGAVSTGWKAVDNKLYGGFNRKEITIFAGSSGAGKSLFLQNLGVNWAYAGLNVVYISLELAEEMISLRLDAMVTGMSTREVMRNMDDVELRVKTKAKGAGKYRVKYMSAGSTANDIRSFIREYEIECGHKVDALLVDYLDLCAPISNRIRLDDAFTKDKYVSEELRNIASQLDILMVTASQLNRGAVEELEYDHSHIAGGLSKIQTADNVIGIFTSNAMREKGRYTIQFLKTRSSSGVGSHVDLKFDPNTMRISDLDDDDDPSGPGTVNSAKIVDKFQRQSSISAPEETKTKMLDMAAFLKKNDL